jgi:glutamine amidotransferase
MTAGVVVLDYGSGNLRSVERALARVGAEVTVTADAGTARDAGGLVVPGVGALAACMAGIRSVGGDAVIRERVAAGRPVLGLCVGLQVLYDSGDEHGVQTTGLGVLSGAVRRLRAPVLPHMGWNTVTVPAGSTLFAGVEDGWFYFVHSYAASPSGARALNGEGDPARHGVVETLAEHGEAFVAAVECGAVSATQFHPEKSGDAGAALLANWVRALG